VRFSGLLDGLGFQSFPQLSHETVEIALSFGAVSKGSYSVAFAGAKVPPVVFAEDALAALRRFTAGCVLVSILDHGSHYQSDIKLTEWEQRIVLVNCYRWILGGNSFLGNSRLHAIVHGPHRLVSCRGSPGIDSGPVLLLKRYKLAQASLSIIPDLNFVPAQCFDRQDWKRFHNSHIESG
jgi:hypothetical protein